MLHINVEIGINSLIEKNITKWQLIIYEIINRRGDKQYLITDN